VVLSPSERELANRLGSILEENQFSRGSGQILGLLLIVGEELSASEISGALQMSSGGVSMNLQPLCTLGLVQRHSRPGTRRIHYSVQNTSFVAFLVAAAKRFSAYRNVIESGCAAMSRPGARSRLQPLADLFQALEGSHRAVLERMFSENATDVPR
jgi:DNA-binding transcriptional regulator GbsR (MarR family)